MTERRCENCRWFYRVGTGMVGECRRYPPQHPTICRRWLTVEQSESCGEWQDASITPEQAERRELIRQFAVAIIQGMAANPEDISCNVMQQAQRYARDFDETMREKSGKTPN